MPKKKPGSHRGTASKNPSRQGAGEDSPSKPALEPAEVVREGSAGAVGSNDDEALTAQNLDEGDSTNGREETGVEPQQGAHSDESHCAQGFPVETDSRDGEEGVER
jgi:hypothetical protein